MKRIVLIACASKKQNQKAIARELYVSTLFKKSLAYGESLSPDKIFVLSAKYHLLPLGKRIDPYNLSLTSFKTKELKKWAELTLHLLAKQANLQTDEFIFLAGNKYRKFLLPRIKIYKIPLKGKPIGKQLQFLSNAIK